MKKYRRKAPPSPGVLPKDALRAALSSANCRHRPLGIRALTPPSIERWIGDIHRRFERIPLGSFGVRDFHRANPAAPKSAPAPGVAAIPTCLSGFAPKAAFGLQRGGVQGETLTTPVDGVGDGACKQFSNIWAALASRARSNPIVVTRVPCRHHECW